MHLIFLSHFLVFKIYIHVYSLYFIYMHLLYVSVFLGRVGAGLAKGGRVPADRA